MTQDNNNIKLNSFVEMLTSLPNDAACRTYLEQKVWGGIPTCFHCGVQSEKHYSLKTKGVFKGQYKCKDCRERFTVTLGTMFEGSHIPLRKWFIAIYIFSLHKKGVSSHQLASDLGITQKSAWFMLSRIRKAFEPKKKEGKIDGTISCDETFIGGKNKNRHKDKKVENSQGRSCVDKTPVFGMKQEGGDIHLRVVKNTKSETLKPIIKEMVEQGSIVVTDEWNGYNNLAKENFNHVVVNHSRKEYVCNGFSTNNVENFWSLLKRGVYGIYHQVSPKHLPKYCDEFAFRFNARKASTNDKFDFSLINSTKLTYKTLIAKNG